MRWVLCAAMFLCGAVIAYSGAEMLRHVAAQNESPKNPGAGHTIRLVSSIDPKLSLEERLEVKGTFRAEESPLKELAGALEESMDVSVVLDTKKLEEAAVNLDMPLTYNLRNVRLRTALELILGDVGLAHMIKDNVLVITTPETVCEQLVTRVYDARELMKLPSPVKKVVYSRPFVVTAGTPPPTRTVMSNAGPDGGYDIDDLVDLLTTVIEYDSWDDVGGPGAIAEFKGLIAIHQTPSTHEKIEKLLNMLHKAGGLPEKVKVSK